MGKLRFIHPLTDLDSTTLCPFTLSHSHSSHPAHSVSLETHSAPLDAFVNDYRSKPHIDTTTGYSASLNKKRKKRDRKSRR
jgi:hypothetical protein